MRVQLFLLSHNNIQVKSHMIEEILGFVMKGGADA